MLDYHQSLLIIFNWNKTYRISDRNDVRISIWTNFSSLQNALKNLSVEKMCVDA